MAPENARLVMLDDDDEITWTADDEVMTRQPARNFWQTAEDLRFMAFPPGLY